MSKMAKKLTTAAYVPLPVGQSPECVDTIVTGYIDLENGFFAQQTKETKRR